MYHREGFHETVASCVVGDVVAVEPVKPQFTRVCIIKPSVFHWPVVHVYSPSSYIFTVQQQQQ